MSNQIDAFEARFIPEPNSGCWLWEGMTQAGNGYGLFCHQQITKRAHRSAWEIYCGPIPDGIHVLHRCDNRLCVNPEHLFLGTHQDNMKDRNSKGRARGPRGESAPLAKLTAAKVIEIRRLHEVNRLDTRSLADRFGVHITVVQKILKGTAWSHV